MFSLGPMTTIASHLAKAKKIIIKSILIYLILMDYKLKKTNHYLKTIINIITKYLANINEILHRIVLASDKFNRY